jgi:hypothetical protein
MPDYEVVLLTGWKELIEWVESGRIDPENEEEIQCFLYYSMVKQLGSALHVKPKYTTDKPERLKFVEGKLDVGNMHFPDFVLGSNTEIVVEIKFARSNDRRRGSVYSGCKKDIRKMLEHHKTSKRYFILYETGTEHIFLDQHQYNELQAIDEQCKILIYPSSLTTDTKGKRRARKAIKTMRSRGLDFSEKGKRSAQKAIKAPRSNRS